MGEIIKLVYPENIDMKNIRICKECEEDLRKYRFYYVLLKKKETK